MEERPFFSEKVKIGSGTHPASYTMGNLGCLLGVRRPARDVDSPSPFSDEIINNRSYAYTPCIRLHGIDKDKSVIFYFNILSGWKFPVPYKYTRGYAETQLVEALRYKSEGRGFDSR